MVVGLLLASLGQREAAGDGRVSLEECYLSLA